MHLVFAFWIVFVEGGYGDVDYESMWHDTWTECQASRDDAERGSELGGEVTSECYAFYVLDSRYSPFSFGW